jgi:hypothetical protein
VIQTFPESRKPIWVNKPNLTVSDNGHVILRHGEKEEHFTPVFDRAREEVHIGCTVVSFKAVAEFAARINRTGGCLGIDI